MPRPLLRPLLAGSAAAVLVLSAAVWAPAVWAQGKGNPAPLSFGLSQSFQSLTNPGFESPSSGTTGWSITSLSFASASSTPTSNLNFTAGIGLGLQRLPDGTIEPSVNSPNVGLTYNQTTQSSEAKASASYSITDLSQINPPSGFINDQGQFVQPSNPGDLFSNGLKENASLGGSLEFGRDARFGLTLLLSAQQTSYSDTTDPTLHDLNRVVAGVKGRFDYSPQGSFTLQYGVTDQVTLENPQDIYRNTQNLRLGTSYEVSPLLSVNASARYQMVQETGQTDSNNVSADIGADYKYLTGSLSLTFASGSGQSDLTWQQDLGPGGNLSVDWAHGPDNSGNGTNDQASISYDQTINDVSSLNLGLFYSSDMGSSTSPDITAASAIIGYTRQITTDWNMNVGANYRLRDPSANTADTASSAGLFLTISRNWSFGR